MQLPRHAQPQCARPLRNNKLFAQTMKLSVPDILLAAKQHEIDELRRLASRARFVGLLGHMIHALQSERGASSIYLASAGKRFETTRRQLITESEAIEAQLRTSFETQINTPAIGPAKQYALMAWVLLGLESLPDLRSQIASLSIRPEVAVAAISRIIAGLSALIFEVADAALDPAISRSLVALFNFVQGKEQAGQERAVGSLSLAAGICDRKLQLRLLHLIEAQERSFQVFTEFASKTDHAQWQAIQETPELIRLERLRRILASAQDGAALDANLITEWFDCCSERLDRMWKIQCHLVDGLLAHCTTLITEAERSLQDSEGLLHGLMARPPAGAGHAERLFDSGPATDSDAGFMPRNTLDGSPAHALVEMLQAQSDRLARMEDELEAARRSLNERKLVERAKGLLMARLGITEEAAYRMLRQTAMDQNRRIIEVAEAALALPGFLAPAESKRPGGKP